MTRELTAEKYRELFKLRAEGKLESMECTKRLVERLKKIYKPGMRVLDAGCGVGHYYAELKKLGLPPSDYYGIDADKEAIVIARKCHPEANFSVSGVSNLSPLSDSSFDIVISYNVLLHLPAFGDSLKELLRVSRRYIFVRSLFSDKDEYREVEIPKGYEIVYKKLYYNSYSIDNVKRFLHSLDRTLVVKFEDDVVSIPSRIVENQSKAVGVDKKEFTSGDDSEHWLGLDLQYKVLFIEKSEIKATIDPTFRLIGAELQDNSKEYKDYRDKWENNPKQNIVGKSPIHIDLELASGCNLRCPMCYQTDEKTRPESGFMSEKLFKKVIDEASVNGLCSIKLQFRGESLMHPGIVDFCKYAKQKGVTEISFNTNATLLDLKKAIGFSESGPDKIICSVDGYNKDVYESIRVGAKPFINKFENVLRNIIQQQVIKMSIASCSYNDVIAQRIIDDYLAICLDYLSRVKEAKAAHLKADMPPDVYVKYSAICKELSEIKETYQREKQDHMVFLMKYSPKFIDMLAITFPYLKNHDYTPILRSMPSLKQFFLDSMSGLINVDDFAARYAGFGGSGTKVIKPIMRVQMVDLLPDPMHPRTPTNHHEIPEYLEFWSKIVEHVAVEDENDWMMTEPDMRKWSEVCPQLWQREMILYNGETRPCCGDHAGLMQIGNANTDSVESMWNSPRLNAWRKLHIEGKSDMIKGCTMCSLRKTALNKGYGIVADENRK